MFNVLDAINDAAKVHLPSSAPREVEQSTLEPTQQTPEGPTLELVTSVLADLFAGMPLETTASRRGVTMTFVRTLLDGLNLAISREHDESIPVASLLTDLQALELALSICNKVNIKFNRLSSPRWMHSHKLASKISAEQLLELTNAWLDLAQFGNIRTPPTQTTGHLVKGMQSLGIPVHRIAVRINPSPKADATVITRSTSFLQQHFHLHFGSAPQFEINKPRRGRFGQYGRHPMYLLVLTRALRPGEITPPALNDTQTLSALMVSVLAYANFKLQE